MNEGFDPERARTSVYSVLFVLKSNMREEDAINLVLDELIKTFPDINRVSISRKLER